MKTSCWPASSGRHTSATAPLCPAGYPVCHSGCPPPPLPPVLVPSALRTTSKELFCVGLQSVAIVKHRWRPAAPDRSGNRASWPKEKAYSGRANKSGNKRKVGGNNSSCRQGRAHTVVQGLKRRSANEHEERRTGAASVEARCIAQHALVAAGWSASSPAACHRATGKGRECLALGTCRTGLFSSLPMAGRRGGERRK